MNKISSVFSQYLSAPMIDSVAQGKVYNIKVNKEKRILDVYADFDSLVSAADIFATQRLIKSSTMQFSSVTIHARYNASLFDVSYFSDIVEFLKVDTPSLNGSLNDAQLFCKDNKLTVKLAHGGLSLLKAKDFTSLLQGVIQKMFGLYFDVDYSGLTEIDGDSEEYIEQINNVQKKIDREKLEELTQLYEFEEKSTDNATSTPKVIEKRFGEYKLPQIIPESVKPLYGRVTKGKIIPIEKIAYDTGRCTA